MYRISTLGAAAVCTLIAGGPATAFGEEPSTDDPAWQAYQRGEYAIALQLHERSYAETKQPERLTAIGQTRIRLGRVEEGLKDCLAYFNYVPNPSPPQRVFAESCIAEARNALAATTSPPEDHRGHRHQNGRCILPGPTPLANSPGTANLPTSTASTSIQVQFPAQTEAYENRAIKFEYDVDIYSPTFRGWAQVSPKWVEPHRGRPPRRLRRGEFYELVGRSDLAASYSSRRGAKIGLYVTGAVLVAAGAITVLAGLFSSGDNQISLQATGGVMIGVGGVELIVGQIFGYQPVTSGEARHLADLYNERAKQEPLK